MRQENREIKEFNEIIEVMKNCDVCRLALNDDEYPYILPLNFGMEIVDGKVNLYFHSALEGYKADLIKKDNRASFEMDCKHQLQYFEEKGYCTMRKKQHRHLLPEYQSRSSACLHYFQGFR